jgi:hypothetical protein
MSLTQIAVVLTGIWLVITSQEPASSTLTLIVGIVVVVLVLLDSPFVRSYRTNQN